jgi:hypothetical protein
MTKSESKAINFFTFFFLSYYVFFGVRGRAIYLLMSWSLQLWE